MGPPIRLGLLGLGRHGRRYASHLLAGDVPGAALSCFWRRDQAQATSDQAALGVRSCPTWEDLVRDRAVDAVIAAVPANLHRTITEGCEAEKKALLLEKPLAGTPEDARAIAANSASLLMIAQTMRFDPLVIALEEAIKERGRLVGCGAEQRLEPRGLPWEGDPTIAGGGVLLQTGVHAIDALLWATKATSAEVRWASLERVHQRHVEDQALVSLHLTGGAAGRGVLSDVRASKIGASRHHRYQLFFEESGVEADFIDRLLVKTRGRQRTLTPVPEKPTLVETLKCFVAWVREPSAPSPIPASEALRVIELIHSAYRCSTLGA